LKLIRVEPGSSPFPLKGNGEESVSVKIRTLLSFFISINFFLPFYPYFYINRILSISFEMERILLHRGRPGPNFSSRVLPNIGGGRLVVAKPKMEKVPAI
jgi:hypothetical protein